MFQGYHTLVPGLNSNFLEMVWVPLMPATFYEHARLEGLLVQAASDTQRHLQVWELWAKKNHVSLEQHLISSLLLLYFT